MGYITQFTQLHAGNHNKIYWKGGRAVHAQEDIQYMLWGEGAGLLCFLYFTQYTRREVLHSVQPNRDMLHFACLQKRFFLAVLRVS